MKKTSKIIISFAVAIAVVATVLIVAVFKKDEGKNLQPSVLYTLQPTNNTIPADTNAWVNPNAVWSDLVSDTDAAVTAPTMNPNAVTVAGTNGVTQILYVDQFGNIVNPSNVVTGGAVQQGTQQSGEVMDDAVIVPDNTQANDNVTFSEYEVNSQGIITKYNGTDTSVMIPSKINGVAVTGLGDSCFENSAVQSIYIPAGITSIGDSCFKNSKIKIVSFPSTVTYIGAHAFENCTYLSNVTFLSSTEKVTIGTAAFQNCPSLTTIHLPAVKLADTVFGNCTALTSVTLADGSESIGSYCFTNCKALSSVNIPESVKAENMGQLVFASCDPGKLTVITPYGSDAETYAENAGVMTRTP